MTPEILGQQEALARLRRALETGRVPPAFLFWGPEGVGKRLAARLFAAALLCEKQAVPSPLIPHPSSLPFCAECYDCTAVLKQSHPDVTEADEAFQAALLEEEPHKQRNLRVDTVRELTRRASRSAARGRWKVFIVDNANLLVPEAANALLKELEEPEPHTLWILVTSQRDRLLPTVASRCQAVRFRSLSVETLREICRRQGLLEVAAAERWAPAAEGSLSRLLRLARYGQALEERPRGPAAYWRHSQSLPRDLSEARETVEGVLDALVADAALSREAAPAKRRALLELKRALRLNASPQLVVQLALLETEEIERL